jgi:hypothetical protein
MPIDAVHPVAATPFAAKKGSGGGSRRSNDDESLRAKRLAARDAHRKATESTAEYNRQTMEPRRLFD